LEALVLADRIVVLELGRIAQVATPTEISTRPLTPYVADLVGVNLYRARPGRSPVELELLDGGRFILPAPVPAAATLVAVRPSAITVHRSQPADLSARNVWSGQVRSLQIVGDRVRLEVLGPPRTLVDVTTASVAELGLSPGVDVWLSVKATDLSAYAAPS
jgi:molybdate transport system ATP-binding protein